MTLKELIYAEINKIEEDNLDELGTEPHQTPSSCQITALICMDLLLL